MSSEPVNNYKWEFSLDKEQTKKFDKWRKKLPKLDSGAAGGGYSFTFCVTGIGNIITVEREDGHKLDLTDIENW